MEITDYWQRAKIQNDSWKMAETAKQIVTDIPYTENPKRLSRSWNF